MPPGWVKIGSEEEKKPEPEFKPDEFKKELLADIDKKNEGLFARFGELVKPSLDVATEIKQAKETRAAAELASKNKKNKEDNTVDEMDWITNPKEAAERTMQQTMQPLIENQQATAALLNRKEVLTEQEYYHGDIKAKVDALIDAQPLANRANPTVILNAYKSIVYDHMQDIKDGKVKSKLASVSSSGTGTGGHSGTDIKKEDDKLSEDELRAAKKLGVSPENWSKQKRELVYV